MEVSVCSLGVSRGFLLVEHLWSQLKSGIIAHSMFSIFGTLSWFISTWYNVLITFVMSLSKWNTYTFGCVSTLSIIFFVMLCYHMIFITFVKSLFEYYTYMLGCVSTLIIIIFFAIIFFYIYGFEAFVILLFSGRLV